MSSVDESDLSIFPKETVGKHTILNQLDNNLTILSVSNSAGYQNMIEYTMFLAEKLDVDGIVPLTIVIRGMPYADQDIWYQFGHSNIHGNFLALVYYSAGFGLRYQAMLTHQESLAKELRDKLKKAHYSFECYCSEKDEENNTKIKLLDKKWKIKVCKSCGYSVGARIER